MTHKYYPRKIADTDMTNFEIVDTNMQVFETADTDADMKVFETADTDMNFSKNRGHGHGANKPRTHRIRFHKFRLLVQNDHFHSKLLLTI